MDFCESARIGLHSLVIFRGILQNKVMLALDALLHTDPADVCATVDAYSTFAAALYVHTDNFSNYLLKAVLDDENVYLHAVCDASAPVSERLEECLLAELSFLQSLASFDGGEIRTELRYNGFLPEWNVSSHNFTTAYRARVQNLPRHGYGMFAQYHIFTVKNGQLAPVKHPDPQSLESLSGYERERGLVLANTHALLEGKPSANVLLYGDAGTGKSSTVKAVANALCGEGLRLIEVKKNQLYQIPDLVDRLSRNPLKFILFIDDLSFSANDDDFAALKAILEGSVSTRSGNLAVYATSNRRHLVKENFSDRAGDEIHLADTLQELMSLSARFGLTITYSRPDKDLYAQIVRDLATLYGLEQEVETLIQRAEAHALRSGGRSPRTAKQFIELLKAEVQ